MLAGTGCTEPQSPSSETQQTQQTPASSQPANATPKGVKAPKPWSRVAEDALSPEQQQMLAQARAAKKALGQNLMKTLSSAIEGGRFEQGVKACKEAAPQVQNMVSSEHGVELGRTSFKVRNPDNRPRDWAQPFVEARVAEDVVLVHEDGSLATLSPISMKEVCSNCHGPAEAIPPEVKKILAEAYPEDQATGFEVGELRGWFWVRYGAESEG